MTARREISLDSDLPTLSAPLNSIERRERNECEETIRQGWDTFLEVGRALTTIRHKRLYREGYETFEDYCRHRWEFSKTHANRLIEAAAVAAVLTPIGVKLKGESQVRPLVGLAPQKIPAAWKRAQEFAGAGEVTAKVVRRAAEEFKSESAKTNESMNKRKPIIPDFNLASKLIQRAQEASKEEDLETLSELWEKLGKCLGYTGKRSGHS